MNPDNFNMSEQELNAQRRRRAENFKLNIDETEYEDENMYGETEGERQTSIHTAVRMFESRWRESQSMFLSRRKGKKKRLLKRKISITAEFSVLCG